MFVDRKKEIDRLQHALQSEYGRLIMVYGRRRCGKTTLLRRILPEGAIYFAADLRDAPLQIAALANRIGKWIPGFGKPIYPDWESLFDHFILAAKGRTILCIDEFPYLVKNSPELPSILQKIVDQKRRHMSHLILCGSSQQMMYGMALDGASPLYGRCDEILHIRPMTVADLGEYLHVPPEEAIAEFGLWGGVPRYWEIRSHSENFQDTLLKHVLDPDGILYEEPERLFSDEMRTSVQAFSMLSLIGVGCHRLSEIAGRLQKPATQLTRLLGFLIDLGYIRRELPFGESVKSCKKSLYKIEDPFVNFYFTFVVPNKSRLEFGMIEPVYQDIQSRYDGYLATIWEELCRKAVPFMMFEGRRFNPGARWWGSGLNKKKLELDLVADSVDKTTLLIGEVKWQSDASVSRLEQELEEKIRNLPFHRGKKTIKALFVKSTKGRTRDKTTHIILPKQVVFPGTL